MKEVHAEHGGAFFEAIGQEFDHLERRHEVVNADVLDAWYDPAPAVVSALQEHLPWLIRTSPPTHGEGLIHAIAAARQLEEASILLGSGSSSLIFTAVPLLVGIRPRVVLLDPTYGEYSHFLRNVVAAELVTHPLLGEHEFQPQLEDLIKDCRGADLVILVNPNSPTGRYLSRPEVEAILQAIGDQTVLWVDETYIDFLSEAESVEALVGKYRNLVVAKSMSKYYALSGMRVGYLAAHPDLIAKVEPCTPPWPVGLMSQVAAVAALKSDAYYRERRGHTEELRQELTTSLGEITGLRAYSSHTNFLLLDTKSIGSADLVHRLMEHQVYVRNCDSMSDRFTGRLVRVAVKDRATNRRIVEAFRFVLAHP